MGQQHNPSVICCLLGITMFAILANGCAPEANDEGSQPIVAVGPITTSASSGQHNGATNHTDVTSEIPRPAMPDEVVTAEELAAAFDHTADQNLLRVRGVTVSLGPGSDSEILEREIVGSQNGDGIGAHFRSNGARFVTRRVPPTTSDSVIKRTSNDEFWVVADDFIVVEGTFWYNMATDPRWTSATTEFDQRRTTDPFHYLERVQSAVLTGPVETAVFNDGTRRVNVEFDGDMIGLLSSGRGPSQPPWPPADFAFEGSVPGTIEISTDGYITFVEADLTSWSTMALRKEVTALNAQYAETLDWDSTNTQFSLAFSLVNAEFDINSPCPDRLETECD